ncbi:hypothetical protein LSTR_LSTR007452 [Laodelphax striatellus]|uniref:Uncharacterized protein n=1 Tax=Laodelphax striatellus TaxID=195883 RepID=A0A482X3K6_LAOST|nr:hypothetical protein LSTR_LSTR007452 [Laodelphax striatellus]
MAEEPEENPNEGEDVDQDVIGKYEGKRNEANQRHGLGFALLPNGDMYDGQYKFGKRHGKGIYVFRNGARYHGTYRQGMKHGIGKFIYPDGSTYEGEWKKDEKHGYGVYRYANGDHYEGSWHKGKRHGHGSYFHKKDGVKYSGFWEKGKRQGTAQVHYAKFRHHGKWKDNRPIGEGCFTFDTKAIQLGHYLFIEEKHKNFVSDESGWPAETDEDETKGNEGKRKAFNELRR